MHLGLMGSADVACGLSHKQVMDSARGSAGNEKIKDMEYRMSQHTPFYAKRSKYSNHILTNLIVLQKE